MRIKQYLMMVVFGALTFIISSCGIGIDMETELSDSGSKSKVSFSDGKSKGSDAIWADNKYRFESGTAVSVTVDASDLSSIDSLSYSITGNGNPRSSGPLSYIVENGVSFQDRNRVLNEISFIVYDSGNIISVETVNVDNSKGVKLKFKL